jgi:hypothetical protein
MSNIFSAPLELAKNKIDLAMSKDEAGNDPAGQLNVASAPCLAGSTDCEKHWANHYMSRASDSIEGGCQDCDKSGNPIESVSSPGDISIGAITASLAKKLKKMKKVLPVVMDSIDSSEYVAR